MSAPQVDSSPAPHARTVVYDGWCYRDIDSPDYQGIEEFPADVAAVAVWAASNHIDNVWLVPCPALTAMWRRAAWWISGLAGPVVVETLGEMEGGTGALVRSAYDGRIVSRIMRADDPRWGWETPWLGELVADLRQLRRLLSIDPAISPQTTGIRLLHASGALREPPRWPLSPPPAPVADNLAFLRPVQRRYQWLHVIDRNAAYLNAARNATFGAGEPQYWERPVYDSLTPGLWRLDAPVGEGDYRLPGAGLQRGAWHDTATLELATRLGYDPMIRDAWLWPHPARTFRHWADGLAAARAAATGHPRAVIKAIATSTIGMLNHRRDGEMTRWYRPDWWSHIIASNALTMSMIMQRLEGAANGCAVMAANTDMLAVLSESPVLPDWLEISDRIGKFKYEARLSAPLPARRWQDLACNGASLADWLAAWHRR